MVQKSRIGPGILCCLLVRNPGAQFQTEGRSEEITRSTISKLTAVGKVDRVPSSLALNISGNGASTASPGSPGVPHRSPSKELPPAPRPNNSPGGTAVLTHQRAEDAQRQQCLQQHSEAAQQRSAAAAVSRTGRGHDRAERRAAKNGTQPPRCLQSRLRASARRGDGEGRGAGSRQRELRRAEQPGGGPGRSARQPPPQPRPLPASAESGPWGAGRSRRAAPPTSGIRAAGLEAAGYHP